MRKLGFTLVELLVVIVLIGLISFLAIRLPSFSSSSSLSDLLDLLKPDGSITVYKNGEITGKKVDFKCDSPVTYVYKNGKFEVKEYGEGVLFEYNVKNGKGDSFILECGGGYYVFKPFFIKKTDSFEKAKELFTYEKYKPEEGSFY